MGVILKRNLGYRVVKISGKLGIPKITVERVIKEYLKSLEDSALRGENINIDNIVSIKVVMDSETGEFFPRGRVSDSLRSKLKGIAERTYSVEDEDL